MPTPLSPLRIGRARRDSVQNQTETFEIDFALGLRQGIELHAVEFSCLQGVVLGADPAVNEYAVFSLHAEVGGLEGGVSSFPADDQILNSEIIAEAILEQKAYDNATQASYPAPHWNGPNSWRLHEIAGKPLILAQNLTFRVIASANMTCNGPQVTMYYRYVSLTNQELAEQFVLRR